MDSTLSRSVRWTLAAALAFAGACKDDAGDDGAAGTADTTGGSGQADDDADDAPTDPDDDTTPQDDDGPDSTGGTTDDPTDPDTTDPETTDPDDTGNETGVPGDTIYDESFDGPDGSPWPEGWQPGGTSVMNVVLDGGRGRMAAATNKTGRVTLPGFDVVDAEVNVVVEYENWSAQGFGFYVRQNGGVLQDTQPPGQGYGVYAEGGFMQALGIWDEINGAENPVQEAPGVVPGGVQNGVPYHIRFQCYQDGNVTVLRAKMWIEGETEPEDWMVETQDDRPELQGTAGGFAADVYNYAGTGSVYVHHVTISEL